MRRHAGMSRLALLACCGALFAAAARADVPAPRDVPYPGTLRVAVDATDLDHRIFRIHESLDVAPGPLTLLFPSWLPGDHGPYGHVTRLSGLQIRANGQRLAWQRDPVDMTAFHVDVPAGVQRLELDFEHLNPLDGASDAVTMSRTLIRVQWEGDLLYPAGYWSSRIPVEASLKLPAGWQSASSLRDASDRPVAPDAQGWLHYGALSLERLVDAPVMAGLHYKRVALEPAGAERPVTLHLFADTDAPLAATEPQVDAHRRLVQQADKLFGPRHFRHYDFLLWQSEDFGEDGLEHHESSENGVQPGYFDDWDKHLDERRLLPHEYAHSWNGKFRRPADLWTRNYNEPMRNSLLWVYEGQTEYWCQVLSARSGLAGEALMRDHWAEIGAWSEFHHRRSWRSLQDTVSEPAIIDPDRDWPDWQGRQDYYTDAALVWLEADMLIRERTQGRRSLDDFARRFFGVEGHRIEPLTYRFEDVVAALNDVLPNDWAGFLRQRLDAVGGPSLAPALERSGWRLAWSETESDTQRAKKRGGETTHHFRYSIGLTISPKDGTIKAVEWNSPAFAAGLAGGTHVVAVDMEEYKPERLAQAITANKDGSHPIELLVKDGDRYRLVRIDYRGGLRYPALERIPGTPDLLAAQMAPVK